MKFKCIINSNANRIHVSHLNFLSANQLSWGSKPDKRIKPIEINRLIYHLLIIDFIDESKQKKEHNYLCDNVESPFLLF